MSPMTMHQQFTVDLFTEAILYGAYCVLFVAVLYILLSGRAISRTHQAMFGIAILMFLLTTVHMVIVFIRAFRNKSTVRGMQTACILANLNVLLGDSVLLWRAWVVWNRSYLVVAVPSILLAIAAAFGFYTAAAISLRHTGDAFVPVSAILSVLNTIICTTLIIWKIWTVQRGTRGSRTGPSTYRGVIFLIVESGALLSTANTINLILAYTHDQGLPIMLNLSMPLFGILPTMIIVFVHLGWVPGARSPVQVSDSQSSGWTDRGRPFTTWQSGRIQTISTVPAWGGQQSMEIGVEKVQIVDQAC